jgi:hypothetical protein
MITSYNGVRCGNIIYFERRVIPSGKLQQDKVFLQQVLLLVQQVFNNGMRVSGGASGLNSQFLRQIIQNQRELIC